MSKRSEKPIKVFVMDLLCMTPYYDRYLCDAIMTKNMYVSLGSISFHRDLNYYEKYRVHRQRGLLDIIAKMNIRHDGTRQILKGIEYLINLLILLVRFIISRPDIIHVQWIPMVINNPFEILFLKLMKKRGVKQVYTVHNILPHDTGLLYEDRFSKVYTLMDMLICHTHKTKEQLITKFCIPEKKVSVIPHGPMFHDYPRYTTAEARAILGYNKHKNMVLFLGILRPYKGVEYLLNTWKNVVRDYPDSWLIIAGIGDKEYLAKIRNMIQSLGVTSSVDAHFKFIPDNEVPLYYQATDIIVYPYRDITQSGALLTGMAFGKPIIASAVGGFRETIQDNVNGYLVKYGDISELTGKLMYLLNNPNERDRLGKAAMEELYYNYSWDVIARKTIECYRMLTEM